MFITYMYTLPAEVMPTLQAHRACEHTVLAQDAGNFHDLESNSNVEMSPSSLQISFLGESINFQKVQA